MIDAKPPELRDSGGSAVSRGAEVEILCSCDEPYLPHTATMLCSLLQHNGVSKIHLFYSSIVREELTKLRSLITRYGTELLCYEMVPEDLKDFHLRQPFWSVACCFRLLAPRFLPKNTEKVLYLDSDIIVRRSLMELWNTDVRDQAFAAVEDAFWDPKLDYVELPADAKYFNSGVMLINLDYWRKNKVYERVMEFIKNNAVKVNYLDQDALNAVLVHRWKDVPAIWNDQARSTLHVPAVRNQNIRNPAIVHFLGPHKPWNWLCKHPFKYEYHKYRRKTPWRRYRQEGKPQLHLLRVVARTVVPGRLRRWLRSRLTSARA